MILVKLLAVGTLSVMASCSSIQKRTNILIPQIESLHAVNCEVRAYDGDGKRKYDVVFVAWHSPPILDVLEGQERHAEPDWEHWYSRRNNRFDALSDCNLFYIEAEKKWNEYQKSMRKK